MSLGFPFPVATTLATGAFASGCIPAILYTISERENQIAQCKRDLEEAKYRKATSDKLDALIKQQRDLQRFIDKLRRQSKISR